MNIVYHKKVAGYLNELVDILYDSEYFGFKESAYNYVDWILDEIGNSIGNKQRKQTPPYFSKYGEGLYYVSYKRNAKTIWYVFFTYDDAAYYIYYIGNNHTCSQYL